MKLTINRKQLTMVACLILATVLLRLIPHLPNFAPITAAALFAAAYLPKKYAFIVPILSVMISDYLLLYISPFSNPIVDLSTFHPLTDALHTSSYYVWASFAISGLIGLLLSRKQRFTRVASISFLASLQFFLITNFAAWIGSNMYAPNISGLTASYAAGLPFFGYTFAGDLFYSMLFFGLYALVVKQKFAAPHKTLATHKA